MNGNSDKKKKVYRLTDMTIEEVSAVDNPANEFPILALKRDEQGVDVVPDGSGGYEEANKADAPPSEPSTDPVDDNASDEQGKAVWTTAYVNTLPDGAFLYIKPGGKKDETGRTVPRANRMFPFKDANGKIDLPHLRNAISRIPQADIPEDLKSRLQARARQLLEQQKATKDSGDPPVTTFAELAKNAPAAELTAEDIQKAVGMASAKLSQILGALAISPEEAMKADKYDLRHMVGESIDILIRAAKLETMLGTLTMAAPDGGDTNATPATKSKEDGGTPAEDAPVENKFEKLSQQLAETLEKLSQGSPSETTKATSTDSEFAAVMEDVTKTMTALGETIKAQKSEIHRLRAQPGASNACDVDGPVNKGDGSDVDLWPMDMAKQMSDEGAI